MMPNYDEINSALKLDEALKSSEQQPILVFKHSSTCGISGRAFNEFQRYLESPESLQVNNYLIVVQKAREVSNELARLLDVRHESPQAIIILDGQAVWNDSHLAIKSANLIETVSKLKP